MLASMATTLLVPKILSVEEYGYWQLFIFYASYVGFFHLGLNDGVYLLNGGLTRKEINRGSVSSQLLVGVCYQAIFAAGIATFALTGESDINRIHVLTCIAPFMLMTNVALYLGYVFQAMCETRTYSYSCILERGCFLVILVALLGLRVAEFEWYVAGYCCSVAIQMLFCFVCGRSLIFQELLPFKIALKETALSIRVGSKLMLANIASTLVLGAARFMIDMEWGIEAFGQLSLTLSMVNFFLSFVTQAAMVLFPSLRQCSENEIRKFYQFSKNFLALFLPLIYMAFWPMYQLIVAWLPQYSEALGYLSWLLPICVYESNMSICCTTYFKVARREGRLFWINAVTAVASIAICAAGAFIFHSVMIVLMAVVLAITARCIVAESLINNELSIHNDNAAVLGSLLLTGVFIAVGYSVKDLTGLIIYIIAYLVILIINADKARIVLSKIVCRHD